MASLLIIGGSGFFGKSILDAFKRGALNPWKIDRIDIVARHADNLIKSNPELLSQRVSLYNLDITNCSSLPIADYVIHAAASTDAKNYLARPGQEKKNIQLGTLNFCRLAKQFLVNRKILYVSSGAVYGQQPENVESVSEDFDFAAIETLDGGKRDYAAAKRDGEDFIKELGMQGLDVSIARCFAFVGRYLPRDQHFAIGNFIEDGLQGRPINVNADHPVYRSYLYADDLVLWLMTLLDQAQPSCPVVNVGSGEAVLIGDLAKIVSGYFRVEVKAAEFKSLLADRYVPSTDLALASGCPPHMDLHRAIAATIDGLRGLKKIF